MPFTDSRLPLRPMAVAVLAVALACGGSSGSSPTPVAAPTPTSTPAPAPAPAPLTVADVAVSLSNTMNTAFIAAMRAGSPASSATARGPLAGLAAFLHLLLAQPLLAQGNPFQAPCGRGGNVVIRYGGARAIEYNLEGISVNFARCGGQIGTRVYTWDAAVTANGRWRVSEPEAPVKLTGTANVDEITGAVPVACTTSRTICYGNIGGVPVNQNDTPPPASPAPSPTPTPPAPTPAPTPTPTPNPTPPPSPTPSPTPSPSNCSFLGTGPNCVQIQINANTYSQNLGNSNQSFSVFVDSCQVRTTVCFGVGCPNSGGTRQSAVSLRGLGTNTHATIELRPIGGSAPTGHWEDRNLNTCAQVLNYPSP